MYVFLSISIYFSCVTDLACVSHSGPAAAPPYSHAFHTDDFKGGTHVESTTSIKDLIIVEEDGIAKGVRRIMAFTGERACEARRGVQRFTEKIEQIEKLNFRPEKENAVKVASMELAAMTISALEKGML